MIKILLRLKNKDLQKFNYIDLLAGAGEMSEGLIRAGFEPVAHVEMNKEAKRIPYIPRSPSKTFNLPFS